jgi:hypothetical protein
MALMVEAVCTTEMSIYCNETTQCNILEGYLHALYFQVHMYTDYGCDQNMSTDPEWRGKVVKMEQKHAT